MSNGNNPWDKRGNQKPSEIDEYIRNFLKSLLGGGNGNGSGDSTQQGPKKRGPGIALWVVAVLGFLVYNSVYEIKPGEEGIILRFGAYQEDRTETQGGLKWLLPFIEEVIKVNVSTVREEHFGFRRQALPQRSVLRSTGSRSIEIESLMLTQDENVIQINWVVQYDISNSRDFLFNVADTRSLIRDSAEFVLRKLLGNTNFNNLLQDRETVGILARQEMQKFLDDYQAGVNLITFELQGATPPAKVVPSYNAVNEAEIEKQRLINEAEKQRNSKIPEAEGLAQRILFEAEGYKTERVNEALGNVVRFNKIYEQYKVAKDVTKTRMFLETMNEVVPKLKDVTVLNKNQQVYPLLPLNNSNTQSLTRGK